MRRRVISIIMIACMLLSSCTYFTTGQTETTSHSTGKADRVRGSKEAGRERSGDVKADEADRERNGGVKANEGYELLSSNFSTMPGYEELDINASVAPYTINADLSNVENLNQFGNLNEAQKQLLAQNGFVVMPTDSEQLFYIYEENAYKKVPNFVSADSVLQLYHIFYDYTLRTVESDKFYYDLIELNNQMIEKLSASYHSISDAKIKDSCGRALAYFGVCARLMNVELPASFPQEVKSMTDAELGLIEAGSKSMSTILNKEVDYSLFSVRGHYTRSEELGRYFKAMSMYGVAPFDLYNPITKEKNDDLALMAIITSLALRDIEQSKGMDLWDNIYTTTEFFVGSSDDINPKQVLEIVEIVYGEDVKLDELSSRLDEFYIEADKLPKPRITVNNKDAGISFRFMGQRYIPDSEILGSLSDFEKRPMPSGLDVMAVMGSERAEELLDEFYKPDENWDEYNDIFELLKGEFKKLSIKAKTFNLYNAWLYTLTSLNQSFGEGYPVFMQNKAWEDKSLSTSLGSWAELRHDTILYGKQSAVECGGDEPPDVPGYVEPNPEFFNRLLWLCQYTKTGLAERGALSDKLAYKYDSFIDLLQFLRDCALKELAGEELSAPEYSTILTIGGTIEYISSSIAESDGWHMIESDTDKHMAVIADVHTVDNIYLEAGVGSAAEMYVVVPIAGKLYITRGAVFDYYEFTSDERLTDEAWQEKLRTAPPGRPPFVGSYMNEEKAQEVPVPAKPYSSGC